MKAELRGSLAALVVLLAAAGCEGKSQDGRPLVAVSIAPLQYFVDRIGGQSLRSMVLVPAGSDAHTYEPRPDDLRLLSEALALVESGMEFEQAWRPRFLAANPRLRLIQPADRFADLQAPHHHDEDEHEAPRDPHYWLSPSRAAKMVPFLAEELCRTIPAACPQLRANSKALEQEVLALDAELRQRAAALKRKSFVVYHPSWSYLSKDYDLEMIVIEADGREPGPGELAAVIRRARQVGAGVLIAEPELSARAAEVVAAELGAPLRRISPLAYDWPKTMRSLIEALEKE